MARETVYRLSMAVQLFVIAYLATMIAGLPRFWYYPTLHQWSWQKLGDAPGMGWYALALYGVIAALVGYFLVGRLYARWASRLKFDLATPSAMAATILFILYTVWHEAHRWL